MSKPKNAIPKTLGYAPIPAAQTLMLCAVCGRDLRDPGSGMYVTWRQTVPRERDLFEYGMRWRIAPVACAFHDESVNAEDRPGGEALGFCSPRDLFGRCRVVAATPGLRAHYGAFSSHLRKTVVASLLHLHAVVES